MTIRYPGAIIAIVAALLPWLTWVPTRAVIGDSTPDVIQAPARILALLPFLIVAAIVALRDPWLGAFVLYAGAWQWAQPGRFWGAIETSFIAFGALAVVVIGDCDDRWIRNILAWSGALEALSVLVVGSAGTLGHSTYAAAFLALTAPLAPLWLLPVYALGLIGTHSLVAVTAAVAGVLIARRNIWIAAVSAPVAALAIWYRGLSTDSLSTRLWAQGFLLHDWIAGAPMFGWGLGAWYERGYPLQLHAKCPPPNPHAVTTCSAPTELFDVAHNEYAQLAYTGGFVALIILIGWLWTHRAMLATPYAGAMAALLILCTAFFPFRQPVVAAASVVILGLATGERRHA